MPISVNRGQTLALEMEFFQTDETGPALDLTQATLSVEESNFRGTVTVAITDAINGKAKVSLSSTTTRDMSLTRISWFKIAVEIAGQRTVTPKIEMQAS